VTTPPHDTPLTVVPPYLHAIRLATAGLAALSAVIYLLIGLGVVEVVVLGPGDPNPSWLGVPASATFAFGALVMLRSERLTLWALGAVVQVVAISAYFGVAGDRTPPYEAWGILLVIAQLLILGALVVLLARYPSPPRPNAARRPA
jgi:hypothetical protein